MKQRYQSAHDVLKTVKEKLASAATSSATCARDANVLQQVVDALSSGRGYSWVGIYLAVEERAGAAATSAVAQTGSDPAANVAPAARFPETKSEMVVPVKIATRTLGMIDVESGRANALSRQERVLLGQVAAALAQFLTTNRGKLLLRKAREQSGGARTESHPQKGPQSARPERTRAAAGEHSTR